MSASSIRVLVVDDEYLVRESMGCYLEDRGLDVLLAESAEESLDLLNRQSVDCAIVDIRLPGMDGNDLILHAHRLQPSLRFLIHTGSTAYQLSPSLTEIGIGDEDVFRKPLADMSVIVDAVHRCVQGEGTRDGD